MTSTTELIDLCAAEDLADGEIRRGTLPSGHAVAIYNVNGQFFVTDDVCSHGEASLSEDGSLDGFEVECSWHYGRFDIRTGEPCAMPCEHAIRCFPVKIEDGRVYVDLGEDAS
ncbi:non-heme iron oxygenase ferredoxin subunit [Dyella sp. RRB7]|uniref:non-heme iron oxygenase ferredoxin subunit n=1 Tax=Dyella sp. RRB7 TaxID=2919502 RepID=UPI001FAA8C1F|nr:non-heme iron oxygenase ferredoxin subunit [Dyella sp. RRB7]